MRTSLRTSRLEWKLFPSCPLGTLLFLFHAMYFARSNFPSPSKYVFTARINTREADGTLKSYFKKESSGEMGRIMLRGAFESESTFYSFAPQNVPQPVGWGACKTAPDTSFFLAEFHEMDDKIPELHELCTLTANIHQQSAGKSPRGQFGFHVTTHLGNIPTDNTWCSTWEAFFTRAMKNMLDLEMKTHRGEDTDKEMEDLSKKLIHFVIPRLIRPMESEGRSITPVLVHGDLWPGNAKHDTSTGRLMIFDSGACWGHNEADLAEFRAPRYRLGTTYMVEYHRHIPKTEPVEDWEDRNRLYALRYDLLCSAVFRHNSPYRALAMAEMKYLVDNYAKELEE